MQSRISTFFIFRIAIAIIVNVLFVVDIGFTEQHAEHKTTKTEKTEALNVALHTDPQNIQSGKSTTLKFQLTDAMGEPFTDLMVHHDRILHVLIVSENLQIIGHIHPEDFETRDMMAELEGAYTVHFTFPAAGRYILALDVMATDAEYAKYLHVDVAGERKMSDFSQDLRREKTVFGYTEEGGDRYTKAVLTTDVKGTSTYHVKMNAPEKIKAGEMVHITYNFSQDGKPITDLVPFLDAPMHFAIVSTRLDGIVHTHGSVMMNKDHSKMKKDVLQNGHKMSKKTSTGHQHQGGVPEKFGPTVMLMTTFSKTGVYQIFGQLKHGDQILFPAFIVEVEE